MHQIYVTFLTIVVFNLFRNDKVFRSIFCEFIAKNLIILE